MWKNGTIFLFPVAGKFQNNNVRAHFEGKTARLSNASLLDNLWELLLVLCAPRYRTNQLARVASKTIYILLSPEESKTRALWHLRHCLAARYPCFPSCSSASPSVSFSRKWSYFSVGQISPNNNVPTFSRDFNTGSSQKEVKYCWMKCGDVITGCLFWTWIGCYANGRYWIKTDLFLEARPASALPSSFSTLSTIIKCSCCMQHV